MSSAVNDITIRYARREDVPIILKLIQELADYEKESSAVEATVETLSNTIAFAPSPIMSAGVITPSTGDVITPNRPARCLLLFTPQKEPAGMALYFHNYSTWRAKPGIYLEDLFVREVFRKRGYGQRLLTELAKEVVRLNGGRLEWSVLKWNKPSIDFYEAIGAKALTEWQTMRVDGKELEELARKGR